MAKLGYDDNGNFIGLNNIMVRKTLGANTSNVESLCQHPNINKWAHDKPFNRVIRSEHTLNGLEFARLMTEEDRIDSRYGLTFPPYSIEVIDSQTDSGVTTEYVRPELDMIGCLTEEQARKVLQYNYYTFDETGANLKIDPDGQFYGKPYGGGKSYITYKDGKEVLHEHESICRLNDFDGYDHYSKNPFECEFEKVIDKDENDYVTGVHFNLTVKTKRSIDNYGGLTIDNWHYRLDYPNHTPAGNGYLCVGVWSYDGQVLYGLLDATSEYGNDDTAIINKYFMSLDRGNAYHPTVDGYSTYKFVLTNDALNEIAVKGRLDVGLYAVIPFIVNDNIIHNIEVNKIEYPLFAKGGLLNSSPYFLFVEDGIWHVKKLYFDNFIIFGANTRPEDVYYDSVLGVSTITYSITDQASGDTVVYKLSSINKRVSYDIGADMVTLKDMHYGATVYAGEDLINVVSTKKRRITIGDYYKSDNHYMQYGSVGYRPLFQCKVKCYNGIVDGTIYLRYSNASASGKFYTDIFLHVANTIYALTTTIINLKSVKIENRFNTNNDIDGIIINIISFKDGKDWNNANENNALQDDDTLLLQSSFVNVYELRYNNNNLSTLHYYPYIEPIVIEGNPIMEVQSANNIDGFNLITETATPLVKISLEGTTY